MGINRGGAHEFGASVGMTATSELVVATGLTLLAAALLAPVVALPFLFVGAAGVAMVVLVAVVGIAWWRLDMRGGLGAANRVTLLRGGLLALLVGFGAIVLAGDTATGTAWPFALALAALVLDGVDGAVARRTGTESDFGARFDMELDAALALVLAILVFAYDRAGVWVLLLGLPRYAFLAAARWLPALRNPLPPSQRRRVICVVQVATLAGSLFPWVGPPLPALACAIAAVLLYGSFAVDVRTLLRGASVATT
ncbi:MAG: CDP-alcohol phosphatidyltransferase family protein [Candidatus Saccharibacteria bacterium]|nr:CDP-alcohol phosphatidyltransferase family protein [Candidatus Saccharibacteria bacterium]